MSGLGDMGNLLKQAQEMQRQIDKVRSDMRSEVIEGHAGGGVVRVDVTADRQEVKGVTISPEVYGADDPKLLEDLILSALQDALRKASEAEREAMSKVTGGMNLPGLL